jgi:spore coat protein SA
MIYHLLGEADRFSVYQGNAVASNVAELMRLDDSASVVCPFADDSWEYPASRVLVVPLFSICKPLRRSLPRWLAHWYFQYAYRHFLSKLKPGDVVWCHNQPYISAALEGPIHLKGAKLVFQFHDARDVHRTPSVFKSLSPDCYVFVSEALRQEVLHTLPWLTSTCIFFNGADETIFYPLPEEAREEHKIPAILYVGRLAPEKGVHVLIDAMRILEERKVPAVCRIVGSFGTSGSKKSSYVKSLLDSYPSNVQFEGSRVKAELAQEYRTADIVCCPSIWQEPFGKVNVEAMASGVAVVASRVGGIPEIATEGGIVLVEPGSAVQLADALQKLLRDKDLRAGVAAKGLISFQSRFTWTVVYRQYQKIADDLRTKATAI